MDDPFCACSGLGYSPATMFTGWLHATGETPAWLQRPDRQVLLTYQGRTAVGLLCHILGLGPGDEVLLPAYNCGAEVDPFVHAGCRVVFYRIDRAANADVADIGSRLSVATRLVYVTHFFGWPQEIENLAAFCKQRNVLLVEDGAQALFTRGGNNSVGKFGDAVIYSFVKFLALPDGGALMLNQKLSSQVKAEHFPPLNCTFKASLPLFKKWFMQTNGYWQRSEWGRRLLNRSWRANRDDRKAGGRREMLASNFFRESRTFWRMSCVSEGLLHTTDVEEVVARRRRNFSHLHEQLDNRAQLRPLHESLPPDVCPLAYPVYATDPAYARRYFEQRGILVQGWPGYYRGMPWEEYPDACKLKDFLLTLPVHQDLSLAQMDYIAKCANSLRRQSSADTTAALIHQCSINRRVFKARAGF